MSQFQTPEDVIALLRRRIWVILAVVCLGCFGAVSFALSRDKVYEAVAVAEIEDAQVVDAPSNPRMTQSQPGRQVQLIEQRIMARDNLLAVMQKYDLFNDDPEMSVVERVYNMRQSARVDQVRGNAQPWQTDIPPSAITITVRLSDPQAAADVANELLTSVITQTEEQTRARVDAALSFFDDEVARLSAEIEEAEAELADFKRQNTDALPEAVASLRDQLGTLSDTKLELQQEVISLRNSSARQRENVLENQIGLLTDQIAAVDDRIAEIEVSLARAPEVERALSSLDRELETLQERYSSATRRRADAEMEALLDAQQKSDRMRVLERAIPPELPISTSRTKIAAAGGVASVILAVAIALALEFLNPAIRTGEQLERRLGIRPVVTIPMVRSRRDRRKMRMAWIAGGVALLALIAAAVAALGSRVADGGFLSRFWPAR